MIQEVSGSIFESGAIALVNPVNTVGICGKGLALEFKKRYPDAYRDYKDACDHGEMVPGYVHMVPTFIEQPRWIVNFPTKWHWRDPYRLEDIKSGLKSLIWEIEMKGIDSIAIPALGCGLGGLDWADVRLTIEKAFRLSPNVVVYLYPPSNGNHRTPTDPQR